MQTRLLTSLFVTACALSAQTLVVPSVAAAADGNSSTSYPFDIANGRYLYVYDSSHFTSNGVTFPILISQLKVRANAATATWTGSTFPLQLDLSTAAVDFNSISTTWDSNHGLDRATVFNGPFTIGAGSSTTGTPGPFHAVIPFAQPFLYDPTQGDLVIDYTVVGNTVANTPTCDCVTTTGVALAKRVYSTVNPPAATATLWSGELANVLEFSYVPASGLYAGFSANVTAGVSPLNVQFTDSSYSSDAGGITSWAWDVDGDSVTDYTTQNPSHVYTQCGVYTVSLTVTDAAHPAATETKTGYIVVDAISPSFTASVSGGFAPVNVQFTDTSTGPVSAWLWDVDGDSVIDYTSQNPSHVYTTPGTYSVTLTIVNACNNLSVTRANLITVLAPGSVPAAPELMQYQFNEVRGTSVANTATTAAAPATGTVGVANWQTDSGRAGFRGNEAGFGCLGYRASGSGWVNTGWAPAVSGSFSASFWLRKDPAAAASPFGYVFSNGTFRSFVGGAAGAGIRFAGSAAAGNVDSGFTVNGTPGVWQHLCLVVDDAAGQALWYSNGVPSSTVVTFTPNTFAYSSTTLLAVGATAVAGGSNIGTGYDLDDFRLYTRALLGAEVLVTALSSEHATAGSFGSSCPGPGGTPVISGNGVPTTGNAGFAVNLANAEDGKAAGIVFGLTPVANGVLSLAPWLGAGCELQTDSIGLAIHITSGNAAQQAFPVPSGTAFAGMHVYAQWIVLGTSGAVTPLLDINIE